MSSDPVLQLANHPSKSPEQGSDQLVQPDTEIDSQMPFPQTGKQFKKRYVLGLANKIRLFLFIVLGISAGLTYVFAESMLSRFSLEQIDARSAGAVYTTYSSLESLANSNIEDTKERFGPLGQKLLEVANGEDQELARFLCQRAGTLVENTHGDILYFYAYLPKIAKEELLRLLKQSAHIPPFYKPPDEEQPQKEENPPSEAIHIKDLVIIGPDSEESASDSEEPGTDSDEITPDSKETENEAEEAETQAEDESPDDPVESLKGDLEQALDYIHQYYNMWEDKESDVVLDAMSESKLFDLWAALPEGKQKTLKEVLADLLRRLQQGKEIDWDSLDLQFLEKEIIFATVFDNEMVEDEEPGGSYYRIPNALMRQAAESALAGQEGRWVEPKPTEPKTLEATEEPTKGYYRVFMIEDMGEDSPVDKIGIVFGSDANARVYFTRMRKARVDFMWILLALFCFTWGLSGPLARRLFVRPTERMMPIIEELGRGELEEVSFSGLPTGRKDEIGALAGVLYQLAKVNKEIIAAMIDPNALKSVIRYWDRPRELFGLHELSTAIMYTDIEGSTVLSKVLQSTHFQQLVGLIILHMQRALSVYGLRAHDIDGDGIIVAESEKTGEEGRSEAAIRMMQAAVEGYRQTFGLNHVLRKLGCRTANMRFGLHYGKIYTGLMRYLDTREEGRRFEVSAWVLDILEEVEEQGIKLVPPQGGKLRRIIQGLEGTAMSIGSRYQLAGKEFTHFTISPEMLTRIAPFHDIFPRVKIGEMREETRTKDIIDVHDVIVDVEDLEEAIGRIFEEKPDLVEKVRHTIQAQAPELFLSETEKMDLEKKKERTRKNLGSIKFYPLNWWMQALGLSKGSFNDHT